MSTTQFTILTEDGESVITLVVPGDNNSPYIARSDHPNFKAIIGAALEGEFEDIAALFDIADTIALKFQRLSERVTVEGETVYFDGVAVDSALTQQIIAVLNSGAEGASWTALVNFFEKVQNNPSEESRNGLYVWIKAHDGLTIAEDGDIVGYKAVNHDSEFGYRSINGGKEHVRVNDEVHTGRIPNPLGAVVEMARDLVDPSSVNYCSVGLHVGTWSYAKSFGGYNGVVLEVRVNPRDVVAVPEDANGQKVRTCRYTVVGPVMAKYDEPVLLVAVNPRDVVAVPEPDDLSDTRYEADDPFAPGTRVRNRYGMLGTVVDFSDPGTKGIDPDIYIPVHLDEQGNYIGGWLPENLTVVKDDESEDLDLTVGTRTGRISCGKTSSGGVQHGRGGRTSVAAKGHGKHPDQDALGRFSRGRTGSNRDASTGRFA